jgi:hypothetical protein
MKKDILKKILMILIAVIFAANTAVIAAEDEDEDNEVELYSAVITAKSCAEKAEETGNFEILASCPPVEAAKTGYVIFDVSEGEYYYVKLGKIYQYELDEGFGGSIDITGVIVGEKDGIPVIEPEEYTITPKPKPGFFKGCL